MHLMNEKLLREVRRLNSFIKLNGGIGVALPVCWRGIDSLSFQSVIAHSSRLPLIPLPGAGSQTSHLHPKQSYSLLTNYQIRLSASLSAACGTE